MPNWGIAISVLVQFTSTALYLMCPFQKHTAPQMSVEAPVWHTVGSHASCHCTAEQGQLCLLKAFMGQPQIPWDLMLVLFMQLWQWTWYKTSTEGWKVTHQANWKCNRQHLLRVATVLIFLCYKHKLNKKLLIIISPSTQKFEVYNLSEWLERRLVHYVCFLVSWSENYCENVGAIQEQGIHVAWIHWEGQFCHECKHWWYSREGGSH